jgi:hypothetical protein
MELFQVAVDAMLMDAGQKVVDVMPMAVGLLLELAMPMVVEPQENVMLTVALAEKFDQSNVLDLGKLNTTPLVRTRRGAVVIRSVAGRPKEAAIRLVVGLLKVHAILSDVALPEAVVL